MTDMPQQKQFYRVLGNGFSFVNVFKADDYVLLYPEQAQFFMAPYTAQLEPVETIADGGLATDLSVFRSLWLGAASADPPATKDGLALPVGAEYFNTTTERVRILKAAGWADKDAPALAAQAAAAASAAASAESAGYAESARRDASVYRDQIAASTIAADASKTAAANSATAADASETAAANSATAAANSATAADASKTAAANSATAAANSATAADASKTAAANSATAAAGSATAADASKTAAANSATAAAGSATSADASKTAAANSATAAAGSATAADASKTAAANSATAADGSKTAAAASATAAQASATAAAASATAAAASAGHIRGAYATLADLVAAVPAGNVGDFAILTHGAGTPATIAVWDSDNAPAAWVDTSAAAPTSIDWSAVTNKPATFTPPIASAATLGGVKQGAGIAIDGGGVASVNQGATYAWTGAHMWSLGAIAVSTPYSLAQTWNAGAVTFEARSVSITDTASAAGSYLDVLRVGGVIKWSVDKAGSAVAAGGITAGASAALTFSGRSQLSSSADGYFLLANNAGTNFTMLRFGGTSAAFPGLKRSGADLQARLADDSAYANVAVASVLFSDGTAQSSAAIGVKSKVKINPATGAIIASTNVTSVTRNSAGNYSIVVPYVDANLMPVGALKFSASYGSCVSINSVTAGASTTTIVIDTVGYNVGNFDSAFLDLIIFGST